MSAEKHPLSRWLKYGTVPRYDERLLSYIVSRYHAQPGWRNGARVVKRK